MQTTPTPVSQDPQQAPQAAAGPSAEEPNQPNPQPVPAVTRKPTPEAKTVDGETEEKAMSGALRPEVRPHAFVVMPFGKKKGADGALYDFNAIYTQLIKPALEMAGFEAFRADEETASGDILTDMFQELLLADLCIADMSIDNANVFYELGIRHAFRKRGIVHIQAGRAYMPFDVFNVRTIPYHITPEGVPDPAFLDKDKAAISRVTRDTWASDVETVHSPIFNLLDGLVEPDRKMLRTPLATGFWREYNEWKERVAIAQRQKRLGDILLLTEEIKNPLIKEEAIGEAGLALKNMGLNGLALAQYRKGLEVNSRNLTFRREEAFNLNRVGRKDEAIVKLENLLADVPDDTEAVAYLGRSYKEMWVDSWKWVQEKELLLRTAFESYHWLLKSFETYLKGYRLNLDEFYPGVNALTLGTLLVYLADQFDDKAQPDPEIDGVRKLLPDLRGSLVFALETKVRDEKADYWTLISLAELRLLTAEVTQQVTRAYRKALTASRRNQFYLQSSLAQLEILRSLDMRVEFVQAGIDVINEELRRIRKELLVEEAKAKKGKPEVVAELPSPKHEGMVFLFTGYMISNPMKKENQFPPEKEHEIKAAINAILDRYNAGPDDLAITTGMDAGSEILFVESCAERGVPVQAYFPLFEAPYVRDFVSPGGEQWVERFYKMRNHPLVGEFYQPDCVGLPKEGNDVHERNNRWALYCALARGIDKVRLIAFWDGKGEVSKDLDTRLVKHMVDLMRDTGGMIEQINPAKLSHPIKSGQPSSTAPKQAGPIKEKLSTNGNSSKKPVARRRK
ncbi:MAG TPA: tetratricopeptide repeat-containing protein [Anaerolineales bacterium]|nr:tetratricopeptide repeat-containing protein [Anaerolineales bacterium]